MGFRAPLVHVKQILRRVIPTPSGSSSDVPKGHLAVYVGESEKRRFVIPLSYLNHQSFQHLLRRAEEEFGFKHPMGGITIPCQEETFIDLISSLPSP